MITSDNGKVRMNGQGLQLLEEFSCIVAFMLDSLVDQEISKDDSESILLNAFILGIVLADCSENERAEQVQGKILELMSSLGDK